MAESEGHASSRPSAGWSDGGIESGFASPRAAALLSWDRRMVAMLDVEAALARVQARHGLISREAADEVAAACDPVRHDLGALAAEARVAASPVIPLLTRLRAVADPAGSAAVHRGATSQDVIDTAMMLQVRAALDLLDDELVAVATRCAALAREHRATIAPGRTLQQQAAPITIGLVAARWYGAVTRTVARLRAARPELLACQFGGVVGTFGGLGVVGPALLDDLAAELGLHAPDLPWHAERDRIVTLAGLLGGVVEVTGKIAGDVVRSSSTAIGELVEQPPAGPGSSALPHKRNPVAAVAARAACRLAAGHLHVLQAPAQHEFERSAGDWQSEWVALPAALVTTIGAVEQVRASLGRVVVDTARCRANLGHTHGLFATETLLAALADELGWDTARSVLGELTSRVGPERDLAAAATADCRVSAVLDPDRLAAVLAPEAAVAAVEPLIERALAAGSARLGGDTATVADTGS